jgi:uncharacterized membrane protein
MKILADAQTLISRYQQGDAFQRYVRRQLPLVIAALAVFLAVSIALTAGAVVWIGGTHGFLVLLVLIVAPFLLLGSLFLQMFFFFSWLENRAMVRITRRRKHPA